ncbi:phosphate acyltransferase PlsX [Undibacterium sp. RTI2.1]|uniref:phosphate acyltransferase PlsX n=1 Tax=unclassified Undibacterium TaxID=2630295 RepID=UPI002B222F76|nr:MULTISPECIES: phosphate acyltransferase PlsX [unclassified Undibacterium]MEB0033087.1 phosphate acyltransferase PlsX [Undibacterium sp. RTI2.1]MEB0118906.1 phosphate acyltransferase PlsX [Undibacterium sp. RTI2.2]MEB0229432.1 phosphate acyltransferase PlsX [Undibacterium sp. 10I3]MEB0256042.1 phosphate acyltransferase PlsX [Undibacterium sp. 5I1]
MTIKISIDCMGGDHGPVVTVAAAVSFANREPDAEFILVGLESHIQAELKKNRALNHPRISIVNATEVVTMDDPIEIALRRKKDSSMRVALNQVKDGHAQACVSAGNTGALMAVSRYVLKTMQGVDRPAICSMLPNQKNKPTYMLDLGANVDCEPLHLHQFAIMGSALVSALEGKSKPTIGLLNVGEEDIKGNDVVKKTAQLLRADHERGLLNFYGNVEGNDIFKGTTDIVVCDGFVGNVTLKAAEGMGRFVKTTLTDAFKSSPLNMLGALIARSALKSISRTMNPSNYNGGSLLGLRGLVFKSHGSADKYSYEWAIQRAFDAAKNDVLSRISTSMAELMPAIESISPEINEPLVQKTA